MPSAASAAVANDRHKRCGRPKGSEARTVRRASVRLIANSASRTSSWRMSGRQQPAKPVLMTEVFGVEDGPTSVSSFDRYLRLAHLVVVHLGPPIDRVPQLVALLVKQTCSPGRSFHDSGSR